MIAVSEAASLLGGAAGACVAVRGGARDLDRPWRRGAVAGAICRPALAVQPAFGEARASVEAVLPRAPTWCLPTGCTARRMVPPMVHLADLAALGRGLRIESGARAWLLFGLGGCRGRRAVGADPGPSRAASRRRDFWLGAAGWKRSPCRGPPFRRAGAAGGAAGRLRCDRRHCGGTDGDPGHGAGSGPLRFGGAAPRTLRGGAGGDRLRAGGAVRGDGREPRRGVRRGPRLLRGVARREPSRCGSARTAAPVRA